ncbi:beta-ketoacyl-[acyl-carrier-protein] synthase family protein [Amycolatopsis sp. NPDC026612]|uniref:beta-ketoacyl-[acyl-carrier-protein] synthase family protein n=1 Tax=Amycolatopsis sp. NPDC026612 TaxID=3155466 RepID=UPI0033C6495D
MTSTQPVARRYPRVAVAGLGAITALGPNAEALWVGARDGRVAIRPVRHLPMAGYRTGLGGEVPGLPEFTPDVGYPLGWHDPALEFLLHAAQEAAAAAPEVRRAVRPERFGVVVGSCNAGLVSGEHWYRARLRGEDADPRLVVFVPPQALAESVAGAFDARGPVLSLDTACAAGANALGYAADLIRWGLADACLAGGTDALSGVLFAGFNSLESLSPEPAAPYSKDRLGLSLGEGSGMMLLVRADLAAELGLAVPAEIAGYGLSADGYHPTAPHPEGRGAARAIKAAIDAAGVTPHDVGYVNSHGTGTAKNDPAETRATKRALGAAARETLVSSTKSMIGHLLGAAGAVEGIVTVRALQEQTAPPTANFTEPDGECDLDYVPNVAQPIRTRVALSNNFAFGGANATVVFTRGRQAGPPEPVLDGVLVTGVGALTPAGTTPDRLWTAFTEGRDLTEDAGGYRLGRAGLDAEAFLNARQRRRMDRLGVFAVVASQLALEDAGLKLTDENRDRVGVVFGTGVGPMESMERFSRPLFEDGPRAANPAVFPNTVYNAAAGQVAQHLGPVGPTSTVTTGHAASANALVYARDLLTGNKADAMIAVGADTLTDTVVDAYRGLGALRPHRGFALAEAGVALVLERRARAAERDVTGYAEVLGYGIASDGRGPGRWDARGHGIERAIRTALDRAGITADEVESAWTSAAGLLVADRPEDRALTRVFGAGVRKFAPKRLFGEPMGAGGALNAVLASMSLRDGHTTGPALVLSSSLGGTHFAVLLGGCR